MSANMIATSITAHTDDPTELDFDAALAAAEQLTDGEGFDVTEDDLYDFEEELFDEDGEPTLAGYRAIAKQWLTELKDALLSSEVDFFTIGPTVLFITGGLSYGDQPTDAFSAINNAHKLPVELLRVAGLEPEGSRSAAPRTAPPARITGISLEPGGVDRPDTLVLELEGTEPAQQRFTWAGNRLDLISTLDSLSLPIQVTDKDLELIAAQTWETILADAASLTILDGNYARTDLPLPQQDPRAVLDHSRIEKVSIAVTEWDNGYFPDPEITFYHRNEDGELEEAYVPTDAENHHGQVRVIDDTSLYPAFRELNGDFRYEPEWQLELSRPETGPEDVQE